MGFSRRFMMFPPQDGGSSKLQLAASQTFQGLIDLNHLYHCRKIFTMPPALKYKYRSQSSTAHENITTNKEITQLLPPCFRSFL